MRCVRVTMFPRKSDKFTVEPRFTNASHHEQIGSRTNFPNKKRLGVTNGVSSKGTFRRATKIAYCWKYFPAMLPDNIAGNMRQSAIFSAIIARQLLRLYIAG